MPFQPIADLPSDRPKNIPNDVKSASTPAARHESDGSQARHPLTAGTVQAKFAVNKPGDAFEREADQVAERLIHSREPRSLRACPCGGACPRCNPARLVLDNSKRVQASDMGRMEAPPVIHEVLRASGHALDPATLAYMETQLGHDFSNVRVHSDDHAARSARDIGAHAYTVGNHIVFGAAQFNPRDETGARLLAHELTHVIQQSGEGSRSLQRDAVSDAVVDADGSRQTAAAVPVPGSATYHIVVRDSDLDLGGGVQVSDLEETKTTLMERQVGTPWTLVLAIHASEHRLAAQSPPDWHKNAIFYDEDAIKSMFSDDDAFVAWRDQYGPTEVVLYGCEVTAGFEQTIANNLARGGSAPTAWGLGGNCKPYATTLTTGVTSRDDFDRLSQQTQSKIVEMVTEANTIWGHYGGPPVPEDQVLDYLFEGPEPGSWPMVEVIVNQDGDYAPWNPPIPYWNRAMNSTFDEQCASGALVNLGKRAPLNLTDDEDL